MVKRGLKYLSGALLALVLILGLGLFWLLGTSSGLRGTLRALDRLTPLTVAVEEVRGSLLGDLQLKNLRLSWPDGHWQTQELELRWQPRRLWSGELAIADLQLTGVEVQLPAPAADTATTAAKQPRELVWPQLRGWPLRVAAHLGRLQVHGLQLRQGDAPPQVYPELSLAARWRQGRLELTELKALTPFGELSGTLNAGFAELQLEAQLQVHWPELGPLLDGARLKISLDPEASVQNFTGQLHLVTLLGEAEQVQLQTRFHLRQQLLELSQLELERLAAADRVVGSGSVQLAKLPPGLALDLTIEKLNLGPETGFVSEISGTLSVTGHPDAYQGRVDLRNVGEGWREMALSAAVTGNLKGLELEDLRGNWLRGALSGAADLDWSHGFTAVAALRGRQLNPAQLTAEWPGALNFELDGSLRVGREQPLAIDVNGRFLESTLRGRALQGVVDGAWRGTELDLRQLALQGEGIELSASGRLSRRIDYRLQVPRLGGLVPGATGSLQSQGWLRWSPGHSAAELTLQAADLSYEELHLERLDLSASQPTLDGPITLQADGRGLRSGSYRLDRAQLQLEGLPQEHRLDLELAWPKGSGGLQAQGGYADGLWSGRLTSLQARDRQVGDWRLRQGVDLRVGARQLRFSGLELESTASEALQLQGDLQLQPLLGELTGSWDNLNLGHAEPWLEEWQLTGRSSGTLAAQWRRDGSRALHATLELSGRIAQGDLVLGLQKAGGELDWNDQGLLGLWDINLEGGGELTGRLSSTTPMLTSVPRDGDFYFDWKKLNLQLLQPLLPGWTLAGNSQGELSGAWWEDGRLKLQGTTSVNGRLSRGEQLLDLRQGELQFGWDASGLRSRIKLQLAEAGELTGELHSTEPARQALPTQGEFALAWDGLDLVMARPWLPEELRLEGALSGEVSGRWLPERQWTLSGTSTIRQGQLEWQDEDGVMVAPLRTADLNWRWAQESLTGGVELVLADYGRLAGTFAVPLAARFPLQLDPAGEVGLDVTAKLREKGILTALMPGLVQESRGQLEADLQATGSWQRPRFSGRLELSQAGAYLPAAGIRLRDLELKAHLDGDEVIVDRLGVRSGKGSLEGEGRLQLRNWQLAGYSGTLGGDNFQAVNLPELQLLVTPKLTFSGDTEKLQVRGDLTVPEMLIQGRETPSPVRRSADVVVVDAAIPQARELPLELDAVVRVSFGDRVLVKVSGVDARLGGRVTLTLTGLSEITSQGEITVVQGTYAAYGVRLNITRGSLLFAGGPVDQPTLNLLALRTVGEVKAGIQVTGTPRVPVVKLYSEPGYPDTEILAYVVLGRPLDQQGGQTDLLMLAATGLLSKGDSAVLQDKLKNTLGLDVIDIQTGGGDVAGSMITIGKYLTPELFISFGQSLFSNISQTRLRYQFAEHWELESVFGEESGADLYYKIEFE